MTATAWKGLFTAVVGTTAMIGIGYFTNWQTAVLLFVVLWMDNIDKLIKY